MNEVICETKAEFLRAKDRLVRALATTPDDKINWSPSPTARTPLQVVAHAAMAVPGIQGMLVGKPFPFTDLTEADAAFRSYEKEITTREQALAMLEENSTAYLAWLDTVTPEQLASTWPNPVRPMPMSVAITLAADHMRGHTTQIDYIQTIYGDHDWHM